MNIIFSKIQEYGIFVQALLITIITFPFIFLYNNVTHLLLEFYFNIKIQNHISDQPFFVNFITSIVIAPFIETIVFQSFLVPVIYFWVRKISIKSNERRFRQFICLLSAIIFSLVHSFNHTYYPVVIFPFCYLLNFVFVDTYFKEGKVRAFQLTWLIHLFWNLIILIGFYTSEYFM